MHTVTIQTAQNVDIAYDLAGLGERILARLIDYAIFIALYIVFLIIGVAGAFSGGTGFIVLIVCFAVTYVFYDLVCEIFWNGQSVGKKVIKIRVVSLDGTQPRLSQFLLRWVFRLVDFTLTGDLCALIMVAASDKKQRLGDLLAHTGVIKTTPRTSIDQVAFQPAADSYEPVFSEAVHLNDRQVALIHEVLHNFYTSGNAAVVYAMAAEVHKFLAVTIPQGMNELVFLQTIERDYSTLVNRMG
ncbi:RDD family protein [Pedobacter yulinensis]|uniref:RDD family protein n=1 Tax=Pedobacter yulinensis TaxID=2126353 RepID=A0A2T3HS76_9SPHI|nr:RDD family protein [Pedobacter yulinensis]PST85263.1 RDD family protein [Pedobacter yulinensis]